MKTELYSISLKFSFIRIIIRLIRAIQDIIEYIFLETEKINISNLNSNEFKKWKAEVNKQFNKISNKFLFYNKTGGINSFDQKILSKVILEKNPKRILEIGTHTGISLYTMALASKKTTIIDTIDLYDVNKKSYYKKFGMNLSPKRILSKLDTEPKVNFIISHGNSYLKNTNNKYDLIFLDASHRTIKTFEEIKNSIKCLNKEGVILIHDYHEINRSQLIHKILGPKLAIMKLKKLNNIESKRISDSSSIGIIYRKVKK